MDGEMVGRVVVGKLLRDAADLVNIVNRLARLVRRLEAEEIIDDDDHRQMTELVNQLVDVHHLAIKHGPLLAWILLDAALESIADRINAEAGIPLVVRVAGEG